MVYLKNLIKNIIQIDNIFVIFIYFSSINKKTFFLIKDLNTLTFIKYKNISKKIDEYKK